MKMKHVIESIDTSPWNEVEFDKTVLYTMFSIPFPENSHLLDQLVAYMVYEAGPTFDHTKGPAVIFLGEEPVAVLGTFHKDIDPRANRKEEMIRFLSEKSANATKEYILRCKPEIIFVSKEFLEREVDPVNYSDINNGMYLLRDGRASGVYQGVRVNIVHIDLPQHHHPSPWRAWNDDMVTITPAEEPDNRNNSTRVKFGEISFPWHLRK